jgi:hypothetical protein
MSCSNLFLTIVLIERRLRIKAAGVLSGITQMQTFHAERFN